MKIRCMNVADVPFGMKLASQNRWNQVEGDWLRQLALQPDGCFVAEVNQTPVGTACACVFDAVAWISLVLVDVEQRGRGIGSALLRHVIAYLDDLSISSIRLDATPLGEPLYAKFGFTGEFTLARFEGILRAPEQEHEETSAVLPIARAALVEVCRLDEAATGTRRDKLLRHLHDGDAASMRICVVDGQLGGYSAARAGAHAWHIGPIVGTPDAGRRLLIDAATRYAGRHVYLDVPMENRDAVGMAQALGLVEQRRFLRMGRGPRVMENVALLWAGFGPEKG